MRFRINLFPTTKCIARAQWSLVSILGQALGNVQENADVRRSLREILHQARFQANSPQQWAKLFAQALVEIVTDLQNETVSANQAATDARRERDSLQLECNSLRSDAQCDVNRRWDRISTLSDERDQARAEAGRLADRVTTLEKALACAQQAHQNETKCLQTEIADLRRITAEQQLRLNARNA